MKDLELPAAKSSPPRKASAQTQAVSAKPKSQPVSVSDKRPISSTKHRRKFTPEEERNIIEGYKRFGSNWKDILAAYKFNDRTAVDLKDKARNLSKKGRLDYHPK